MAGAGKGLRRISEEVIRKLGGGRNMLFETFGNRQNPAVLFFHAMGVTGAMLIGLIGNYPFTNAVSCAWISIGNL